MIYQIKSPEAYSPRHNHYPLTLAIDVWLTLFHRAHYLHAHYRNIHLQLNTFMFSFQHSFVEMDGFEPPTSACGALPLS